MVPEKKRKIIKIPIFKKPHSLEMYSQQAVITNFDDQFYFWHSAYLLASAFYIPRSLFVSCQMKLK